MNLENCSDKCFQVNLSENDNFLITNFLEDDSLFSANIGEIKEIKGLDGATYVPKVDNDGVISWENDKGLPNPEPKNIKGPPPQIFTERVENGVKITTIGPDDEITSATIKDGDVTEEYQRLHDEVIQAKDISNKNVEISSQKAENAKDEADRAKNEADRAGTYIEQIQPQVEKNTEDIAKLSAKNMDVSFDNTQGLISVGDNNSTELTGVSHDPSYDKENLKITIPVYGKPDLEIEIPEDKFVTGGRYNPDTKSIELIINDSLAPIIIPAASLVDIYLADNTDKNLSVTVTNNKISAELKLDPTNGNALTYSEEQGFMVDISKKLDTYESGVVSEIMLSDSTGKTINCSGKTILSDNVQQDVLLGDSIDKIPVASIIARAILTSINAAITALKENELAKKMDKLMGINSDIDKVVIVADDGKTIAISDKKLSDLVTAEDLRIELGKKINKLSKGPSDEVIVSELDGNIKRSGKKIGSAIFNGFEPDIIPTADEIVSQFSWDSI